MPSYKASRKTFIVGDIHGCFTEFLELLKKVSYEPKTHRLILTGDMINRGPDSLKILEWVKREKVEVVRGNHEQLFIEQNFLPPVLKKLAKDMGKSLQNWLIWLKGLPFYIEDQDFLVVHAGLVPHQEPKDSDPHLLMHIRNWPAKDSDSLPWHDFIQAKNWLCMGIGLNKAYALKKTALV